MEHGPYDPRAIANLILDFADSAALPIRHIALQKLLYFAHATFLIQRGRPLVSGYFEAWQYGPVHPATYQAYKEAAEKPIDFRAKARNVLTGDERELSPPADPDVRLHIMQIVSSYGRLSTRRLIELSHAPGGPWDSVTRKQSGAIALGARITDDVIRARFARPVGSVTSVEDADIGEPDREDDPVAGHGRREFFRA